jgi:hypothetical protein
LSPQAVLSPNAIEVCQALSLAGLIDELYLAGDTVLALQLSHRRSDDLDFFTVQPAELIGAESVTERIEKTFGRGTSTVEVRASSQLTWKIEGVKVSFVAYPFPPLHRLVDLDPKMNLGKVRAASVREIAAMKSYALGRRAVVFPQALLGAAFLHGGSRRHRSCLRSGHRGGAVDRRRAEAPASRREEVSVDMTLPTSLSNLFANYAFESLDSDKHASLVIKTVLARGCQGRSKIPPLWPVEFSPTPDFTAGRE